MRAVETTLVLVLLGLTSMVAYAQVDRDLASWSALELGYELDDNWKLGLEGQFRLKENFETIDEYFGEFRVTRKIAKGFSTRLGLRYIRRNDNQGNIQGYENRFRYHLDARYKHKVGSFRLGYRLRYQNRNELGVSKEDGDYHVKRVRFKTGIEYKIKNWPLDPKVAGELFSRFEEGTDSKIDKFRLTIGSEYSLKRAGAIEAYWRLERSIGEAIPDYVYIIGLSYKYNFKSR